MKRREVLDEITYIIDVERDELDHPSIAKLILSKLEDMGMFYCPAKQFGDIGILRQPIGFEDEE
jgi:IMP cyclohydrolase